jgi:hypothetical protein
MCPGSGNISIRVMSTPVLTDGTEVRTSPATARPLLFGAMAALSVGAAAIHFAVTFEHFSEYSLYGVFFLILAWAQLLWPVVLIALPFLSWAPARARPARYPAGWLRSGLTPPAARRTAVWLWLGIVGNVGVLAVYFSSRSIGLPIGPDTTSVEAWGGLDLVCAIEEILLVVIAAAVLARPGLLARPVRFRSEARSLAGVLAVPVALVAATAAVMTPAWAGSEGPAGMASGPSSSSSPSPNMGSSDSMQGGMGDMGSTDGLADMQMYGDASAPTAAQVQAAANLITQTDASLVRFEDVNNAIAAGYTDRLATNGEEHLLYAGSDPAYQGLNPQDPSSLVYAVNVKGHAPILLGAMYLMPDGVNGPQVGGGLTRWHSHLKVCQGGEVVIAGFGVELGGQCDASTWTDKYTTQMLHVWVAPYPGGVFSDDLSTAATTSAAQAALAETKPGQPAP